MKNNKQPSKEESLDVEDEVTEVGPAEETPADESTAAEASEETPDLEQVLAERDEYKDKFLRTYAEFENFRKRTVREKEDLMKYGNERLLKEVLAIKDDLERALEHQDTADTETLKEGLALIGRDLTKILSQFQVEELEAVGQPFDPKIHEALAQEESEEHEQGTVLQVFQKGYTYHGRLLRPAKVLVVK